MAPGQSLTSSIFETPTAPSHSRKRSLNTPVSMPNFRSHKKRRMSMASVDLSTDLGGVGQRASIFGSQVASASTPSLDRFISYRPESIVPLTISPRTNRMCKQFGVLSGNRLSFKGDENDPHLASTSSSKLPQGRIDKTTEGNAYDLLRRSASTLLNKPKKQNPCSVSRNLVQNPRAVIVLDSPGLTTEVYSQPLSWSLHNHIAVACDRDIYYQNLETKTVTRFFRAGSTSSTKQSRHITQAICIDWGGQHHETHLACINDMGLLEVWDAAAPLAAVLGSRREPLVREERLGSICWNGHQVTWSNDEKVFATDLRTKERRDVYGGAGSKHSSAIISMAWNKNGVHLATGDLDGVVHVWDVRSQKMLTERGKFGKMRHGGPVKSLAWCPWSSDLLATGTFYPEGTVRSWNISTINDSPYEPEKTLRLNSAVHSIIWSPKCKEMLTAHGVAWEEPPIVRRKGPRFIESGGTISLSNAMNLFKPKREKPKIAETPLTNAILVHEYPSGKHLLTLSKAHRYPITAACLGPNGNDVFTASPREQTIKMWQVWGEGPKAEKEKPFSTNIIR